MREMSSEMATLLKSKKMIGDNRATHEIILDGVSGGDITVNDLVDIVQGINATSDISYSNYVPTNDGRFMEIGFNNLNELIVGYTPDERFFNEHYAWESKLIYPTISNGVENVIPITTKAIQCTSLFKRDDGKILAFINDLGNLIKTSRTFCLISNSGNGDDFIYYSTIHSLNTVVEHTFNEATEIHIPLQIDLDNGGKRLIINFSNKYAESNVRWLRIYIYTSDDKGLNWVKRANFGSGYSFTLPYSIGQAIELKNDGEIYFELLYSSQTSYLMGSYDRGLTWSYLVDGYENNLGDTNIPYSFFGSYYMDKESNTLYRMGLGTGSTLCIHCIKNPTDILIKNNKNWVLLAEILVSQTGSSKKMVKMPSGMISASSSWAGDRTVIVGFMVSKLMLQAKSITINRTNGMSSNLNIEFDNKDGILAPDKEGGYHQLLWPNKEIIVKQGYGQELIQTYKGWIDTVNMSTFPQEISISARDDLKRALDQTITTIYDEHVIGFMGHTVEYMFTALAQRAGLTLGTVEETGITISEKVFSWETYADCFSWLSELVGFEIICDELGVTHFRKEQIPDAVIASYIFREGEDIISLGYTLNDNDLYSKVIVHGLIKGIEPTDEIEGTEDEVIEIIKDFTASAYWNLLPQKVLKIDASECDTIAKCEAIADKAIYLMISRARVIQFKSIGIPNLQIGDFIEVVESSTTISEIYRITDISTNQDASNYTMNITCYWYSHN